ncbi:hypothetical protein LOZ86_13835 [Pectobacterium parvum]|uniref:Uncharacterized protein n=1 Tax=Pectobacterium parvum TaxID=2778550 RepID=A0AAP9LEF3_9GAMM|nr:MULTISPECIES: hypothetical protein [Pectobacterium]QHQ26337.1 hypothetical protein GMX10_21620 [Pectobacterium parvum]UFK38037.1 hypothetical protein LOZ86_13835 [Pectobacterium parvum]UVD98901.1 hypothetical protein NV347_07890 [Pectobacterium parvum]
MLLAITWRADGIDAMHWVETPLFNALAGNTRQDVSREVKHFGIFLPATTCLFPDKHLVTGNDFYSRLDT